jgi:hypothetical protein
MDLIELCYGKGTNIYQVLDVVQDASSKDIQSAFMQHRLELYQKIQSMEGKGDMLAEEILRDSQGKIVRLSEKQLLEKKMDALVTAFRILRDARKRQKYDNSAIMINARAPTRSTTPKNTSFSKDSIEKPPTDLFDSPKSLLDFNISSSHSTTLSQIQIDTMDSSTNSTKSPLVKQKKISKSTRVSSTFDTAETTNVSSMLSKESTSTTKTARRSKSDTTSIAPLKEKASKRLTVPKNSKKKRHNSSDDVESVDEYYQDIVKRGSTGTSVGSWLRSYGYKSQASSIDEMVHEMNGSFADVWLSFSQVASAFSIEEDAIDAMAGTIEDTADELSAKNYM